LIAQVVRVSAQGKLPVVDGSHEFLIGVLVPGV